MRPFAALLLLACSFTAASSAHKHDADGPQTSEIFDNIVTKILKRLDDGADAAKWPEQIVKCGRTLGVSKCFQSFSVWRAENALNAFSRNEAVNSNLVQEFEKFPWERFTNSSEQELDARLSDGAVNLLQFKTMSLSAIPGVKLELASTRNGKLTVDVCKTDDSESRGMSKKIMKKFYSILPLLVLPGLLMSAVLPFILPALKLMTVGVGMLNQMALTGAVFTLLRNNAFNDKYHKRIIYVNEGYKNAKPPVVVENEHEHIYYNDDKFLEGNNEHGLPSDWDGQYYAAGSSEFQPGYYYKTKRNDKSQSLSKQSSF